MAVCQESQKVGGRAAAEPEIAQHLLVESVQQAIRIVDVGQVLAEMVAVVLGFEHNVPSPAV